MESLVPVGGSLEETLPWKAVGLGLTRTDRILGVTARRDLVSTDEPLGSKEAEWAACLLGHLMLNPA